MKPDFRIEIPKPCRAGWETMEAAEKGRFCGECSKIVIDFTAMSTDEIKAYFLQHKDQKICGHFISSQISRKMSKTEQFLTDLHIKTEKISYRIPRIAASFVIVSMMTLTGCGGDEHVAGEMIPIDQQVDGGAMMITDEMQHQIDSITAFEKSADSLKKQANH